MIPIILKGLIRSIPVCVLLAVPVAAQSDANSKSLVGTYRYSFNWGGTSLTLNSDGTFVDDSASCTFTTEESGTYIVKDGKLRLTMLKYIGNPNFRGQSVDLFDAKARREFFGYPDTGKDETLNTLSVLIPIKWGERTYLIYESDLAEFTNAINFGIEPRALSPQDQYLGTFLLREGDEGKKVTGKPSLPERYLDLLLPEEISATIVSLESTEDTKDKKQIATIDKGRLAGVKVGIRFLRPRQSPDSWSDDGVVLSVDDNSAKVRVYDRVVGEVLTTKYVAPDPYRDQ